MRQSKSPPAFRRFSSPLAGILVATIVYLWETINPASVQRSLSAALRRYLEQMVVRRALRLRLRSSDTCHQPLYRPGARSRRDRWLHPLPRVARTAALPRSSPFVGDRWLIDNGVDTFAEKTWNIGLAIAFAANRPLAAICDVYRRVYDRALRRGQPVVEIRRRRFVI